MERKRKLEALSAETVPVKCPRAAPLQLQQGQHVDNASSELTNVTFDATNEDNDTMSNDSDFELPSEVVNGAIICDMKKIYWRLGKAIGKGGFGEVFLASNQTTSPVTSSSARYVAKVEKHTNGSLFREMHFLLNAAKRCNISGAVPKIFAHGSHSFNNVRFRFVIMERYHENLALLINQTRVARKAILILAINIVNALENLHNVGCCHNDVKAENIMIKKHKCAMEPINNMQSESRTLQPNSLRRSERIRDLSARRVTGSSSQQQPVPHGVSAQSNAEHTVRRNESLFLIDLGLATKFQDYDVHRPFRKRLFGGTLLFSSRDAHLGTFWRRSDMESLGYNLLYWSEGYLPWSYAAENQQFKKVHHSKEFFMISVREMLQRIYGRRVPKCIGEYLELVSRLQIRETPNYEGYRNIFQEELRKLGYLDSENRQLNSMEIKETAKRIRRAPSIVKRDIFVLKNNVLQNSVAAEPILRRVFLKNPSEIARERATKESEHNEASSSTKSKNTRHYEGNPTYAISEVLQRLRSKGTHANNDDDDDDDDDDGEGNGNENNMRDARQQGAQANDNCEGNDQSLKGVISKPQHK